MKAPIYTSSVENGILTIFADGERVIGFAKPKALAIASQLDALRAFVATPAPAPDKGRKAAPREVSNLRRTVEHQPAVESTPAQVKAMVEAILGTPAPAPKAALVAKAAKPEVQTSTLPNGNVEVRYGKFCATLYKHAIAKDPELLAKTCARLTGPMRSEHPTRKALRPTSKPVDIEQFRVT